MARTLVGILQILLKQDVTQKAPAINAALSSIGRSANQLGAAQWGSKFDQQLNRLKVSPAERAAISSSFGLLAKDINGRISRANLTQWKTSVISNLAAVRAEMKQTSASAKAMQRAISTPLRSAGRAALVAGGAYTGVYGAGMALRGGISAASDSERQGWREQMAGVSEADAKRIVATSFDISERLRGVSETEIRELALRSLGTMGDIDRVLKVLPSLSDALVVLKSSKGVGVGPGELGQLMRGIDVLGQNEDGDLGITQIRQIVEGAVRASQIEGMDLDVGKYWEFARRSKIASSALSTEFLATAAPAIMQDMGSSTVGAALASAYQAFVTGSSATASKVNLKEQRRLGLRSGTGGLHGFGDLIGDEQFGSNPYAWVKEHLVPALAGDGVDMASDVAVQKAIAKLTRNTNASSLLTRFVLQQDQIDKNVRLYAGTMGLGAAGSASSRDPYVAYEGLQGSFKNLAAAVSTHVDLIVPGLNSLTDVVNRLSKAVKGADDWQMGLGAAGGVLGLLGAYKVGAGLIGGIGALATAGPSLQTAAIMLQNAATAQGGGLPGGKSVGSKKIPGVGLLRGGAFGLLLADSGNAGARFGEQAELEGGKSALDAAKARGRALGERMSAIPLLGDYMRWGANASEFVHSAGKTSPASEFEMYRGSGAGIWAGFNPDITSPTVDAAGIAVANTEAQSTLDTLGKLGNTITPIIDTTYLVRMVGLLQQAISLQQKLKAAPIGSVDVRSSFSDYGVAP